MLNHKNIKKFIEIWLPRYPNRFYEFGIYPTFFRKQRELAEQNRDYVKVLHLEADAAENVRRHNTNKIPIAYGLKGYQKHRDAYRQYASHLRSVAQQNPSSITTGDRQRQTDIRFTHNSDRSLSAKSKRDSTCKIRCACENGFSQSKRRSRLSHVSRVRVDSQFLQSQSRKYRDRNY